MRWTTGLWVMAMVWMVAWPAWAQPEPPPERGPARPGAESPAKQRARLRLLQQRVGLDEPTARKVLEVLRSHESRRAELQRQQRQHRRELGRLVRRNSEDDAAYRRAIDALMRTQVEMESLRRQEFEELRKVLTPRQQGRLLVELNRLMKQRRRGPGGPPGDDP